MDKENNVTKIIYKDTWYDVMKMKPGGDIECEMFSDGSILFKRFDSEGKCLEKTRSHMAANVDFNKLCNRLEKIIEAVGCQFGGPKSSVSIHLYRNDGGVDVINCGMDAGNSALENMVWDYLQQFVMSSDDFI